MTRAFIAREELSIAYCTISETAHKGLVQQGISIALEGRSLHNTFRTVFIHTVVSKMNNTIEPYFKEQGYNSMFASRRLSCSTMARNVNINQINDRCERLKQWDEYGVWDVSKWWAVIFPEIPVTNSTSVVVDVVKCSRVDRMIANALAREALKSFQQKKMIFTNNKSSLRVVCFDFMMTATVRTRMNVSLTMTKRLTVLLKEIFLHQHGQRDNHFWLHNFIFICHNMSAAWKFSSKDPDQIVPKSTGEKLSCNESKILSTLDKIESLVLWRIFLKTSMFEVCPSTDSL